VASLATDLRKHGLEGFSLSNLKNCRQCYKAYPQIGQTLSGFSNFKRLPEISQTPSGQSDISSSTMRKSTAREIQPFSADVVLCFSWSHLIEFIRLDDTLKRAFYENECLKGNWSVRQLQRQIGSLLFERTGLSRNKAAVIARARRQQPAQSIAELIRDPYVLEFTGLGQRPEYTESDLETALLDHLQKFLLELGAGFLFEARQRRITVGNEHDYIDLVFYHRHLRCHVLLDLKIRPFKHGDAGQMNFYLNWWRENVTAPGEQPPVGVILCSDKDHTKVQFATAGMDNKLFVSRYLTALPSAEQLQRFVESDRAHTEAIIEQQKQSVPRKTMKNRDRKRMEGRG
jgi:predicted nuclease of restriction endonuclease-like (RecB) superfamily